MTFDEFMTDTVFVIKNNGNTFEGVKASVQSTEIYIMSREPLIEPGDVIQRKMSNGGEETYEVIDPGFFEEFEGFPAHYQMKVRKLGVPETKSRVQKITYNVSGSNARINQNSVDSSVNISHSHPDVDEKLTELRKEIHRLIENESQRSDALSLVDAIEGQFAFGSPNRSAMDALINALPRVGNIASIGSFLLSCLS